MAQGFRRALMRDTGTGSGEDDTTDESQGESVLLVKPSGRRKHHLLPELNIVYIYFCTYSFSKQRRRAGS